MGLQALPTQRAGFAWASRAGAAGTHVAATAAAGSEPIARNLVPTEPVASPYVRSVSASPQLRNVSRAIAAPTVLRFQNKSPFGKPIQQQMRTLLASGRPSAGLMLDGKVRGHMSLALP